MTALAALMLFGVGAAAAKAKPLKASAYRKYFWGARDAFDHREFSKAAELLAAYRGLGSPRDRLVDQSGCHDPTEVPAFAKLLKDTRACIASKQTDDHAWENFERAKLAISQAFEKGTPALLTPFVGCAPIDLTYQREFCPGTGYASLESLEELVRRVSDTPDVWRRFIWRDRRVAPADEVSPRWVLTTASERWKPHGLPDAPILTLRQDREGRIRIAGFAATLDDAGGK